MADTGTTPTGSGHLSGNNGNTLGQPVDIRGLGRRLPKTEAPEGWVKKIERSREGTVWVGFFHLWTTDGHGRRVRTKKEKTLGPASMPKHSSLNWKVFRRARNKAVLAKDQEAEEPSERF